MSLHRNNHHFDQEESFLPDYNAITSKNHSRLSGGESRPGVGYSDLSNTSQRVPSTEYNAIPLSDVDYLQIYGGDGEAARTSPLIGSRTIVESQGEQPSRPTKPLLSSAFLQPGNRLYGGPYESDALEPRRGVPAGNSGQECLDNTFGGADFASVMSPTPPAAGTCGCPTKGGIYTHWTSPLSLLMLTLSIYSTVLSGVYLFTAIIQPRWGQQISSGHLSLGTVSTLTALFAKTIELSSIAVFTGFLGQVISRRSLVKNSRGVTISEICLRSWVLQPGFMITHWETVKYAGWTFLGILSLTTTASAMFYTTASDALVSPKLRFGGWEDRVMQGLVQTSYANSTFVSANCRTPVTTGQDNEFSASTCLQLENAGRAYHNYLTWISSWAEFGANGTSASPDILLRPRPVATLHDNISVQGSWILPSDMSRNSMVFNRVVNNITMAMPHAGIYTAARDQINGILQPADLDGQGEYRISAAVLSPAVNVLCADLLDDELTPMVRSKPFNSTTQPTGIDDLYQWGSNYGRDRPYFNTKPIDFNILMNTNAPSKTSDSLYLLAKSAATSNYTLCALRSFLSTNCSTKFLVSGVAGGILESNCENGSDRYSYSTLRPDSPDIPSSTWPNMSATWALALALNDGSVSANASNARLLTQFIPTRASLPLRTPSIAEALAVLSGFTLLQGISNATFVPPDSSFLLGSYQQFNASVMTQQYTSAYTQPWQACFYPVLALVFLINVFCLLYALIRPGLATDYTEPQNLLAIAINSPPSRGLAGSCGGGPEGDQFQVSLFVSESEGIPHYFVHEGASEPCKERSGDGVSGSFGMAPSAADSKRSSSNSAGMLFYQRLSSKPKSFL